jgi:DNA polymerase III subunit epsilon
LGEKGKVTGLLRLVRRKAAAEVRYARRKAAIGLEGWSEPLRTMTFTALACETTGRDPGSDAIVAIGAVKVRANRIAMSERFHQVFKPTEAVSSKEVLLAHGLGPEDGSRGMALSDALGRLVAFVGESVVVGHGTVAGLRFLNAALAAQREGALASPALDTRLLHSWWRRRTPEARPRGDETLEQLAHELGVPRYPAHHAFYDALTTGLVFLKLLGELEASGAVQFRDLYREAGVY